MAGRPAAVSRMAAIRCRSTSPPGWASGNGSYPALFQPFRGFPDEVEVEHGYITMPDLPGIDFASKADLYAEMR